METEIIIRLKLAGETHELSHDEARELWQELNKIFQTPFHFQYQPYWQPCTTIPAVPCNVPQYIYAGINATQPPLTWSA